MSATAPAAPEGVAGAAPLTPAEFAASLERLGPFEAAPRLAVAVSGGPDSMALALLAAGWARARGGSVVGITVDHALRPGSADEAATVGRWLRGHGLDHAVLTWTAAKPASGVQSAARDARYALLQDWCRQGPVLHLLLAHHRDDQAETVAHRAGRGSGPDGLAGMPAVREVPGLRLLRPLLDVPKARLVATLEARGQPWLEDPSNRSARYARSRVRAGPPLRGMVEESRVRARSRLEAEGRLAAWLARHAMVDPLGFVLIARRSLRAADPALRRRVLRAAVMTASGQPYPPPTVGLVALADVLAAGDAKGRTLGGARIAIRGERVLVAREAGAIDPRRRPLAPGLLFDGRFRIEDTVRHAGIEVGALREAGWQGRRRLRAVRPGRPVARIVGEGLVALFDPAGLVAVPQLGLAAGADEGLVGIRVTFRPRHPLGGAPFADLAAMPSFASPM